MGEPTGLAKAERKAGSGPAGLDDSQGAEDLGVDSEGHRASKASEQSTQTPPFSPFHKDKSDSGSPQRVGGEPGRTNMAANGSGGLKPKPIWWPVGLQG